LQKNSAGSGYRFPVMRLRTLFTAHPASVGEGYAEHLAVASGFGVRMVLGGLACLIHGVLPFLFTRTGSDMIRELHGRMVTHRRREAAANPELARAD
jgi:hypothetical protein